jgi:hypothetical protein
MQVSVIGEDIAAIRRDTNLGSNSNDIWDDLALLAKIIEYRNITT